MLKSIPAFGSFSTVLSSDGWEETPSVPSFTLPTTISLWSQTRSAQSVVA